MSTVTRRLTRSSLTLIAVLGLVGSGFLEQTVSADSLRDEMIAKAKKEGEFVVAGSSADNLRDDLKGFSKAYPFISMKAFTANTADSVNRISSEAKAGRLSIDVAATSNDGLELLAKAGLLQKMEFPHLKDIPPDTQPKQGLYLQLFLNPRVQGAYNATIVDPKDAPKSWDEMLDPKWTGKTMISRSSEDIPAQLAYLWKKNGDLDWERSFDFFTKLMKQKPVIARGYRGGTNQLAAGEAGIFWFDAVGPPSRLAGKGAPLRLIAFPKFTGTFRSFGVLKGAQHPASSWLFIDYLSSPEGQFEYTNVISGKVPVNKKAKVGKLGKWLVDQNVTVKNTVPLDAEVLFDTALQKKSEHFFFQLLGIK
jgi:iron(III) transport system substrate-binding protein